MAVFSAGYKDFRNGRSGGPCPETPPKQREWNPASKDSVEVDFHWLVALIGWRSRDWKPGKTPTGRGVYVFASGQSPTARGHRCSSSKSRVLGLVGKGKLGNLAVNYPTSFGLQIAKQSLRALSVEQGDSCALQESQNPFCLGGRCVSFSCVQRKPTLFERLYTSVIAA